MNVFAVVYSDYDPAEVAALFTNREAADRARDHKNREDTTDGWAVVEWPVAETFEEWLAE